MNFAKISLTSAASGTLFLIASLFNLQDITGLILNVLIVLRILLDLDDIDDTPDLGTRVFSKGNEFLNDLDMNCASK